MMSVGFRFLLLTLLVIACVQYGSAIKNRRPLPTFSRKSLPADQLLDDNVSATGSSDSRARTGTSYREQNDALDTMPVRSRALHNPGVGGTFSDEIKQQPSKVNPLLMRSTTASVCLLFGLLIWRSLASYEMADQFSSQTMRLLATIPVIMILFANVVGLAVNLIKPLNFKNHLKAILAANIMREWIEVTYNLFMMLFAASNAAIPRTEYMGRIFMNVWWNLICFSFIKSRWVLSEPTVPGR